MLIKNTDPKSLWIRCEICKTAFHPGGKCKCGNIESETDRKSGVTRIVADDTDAVVYDND